MLLCDGTNKVESVWYEWRNLVYAKQFENAAELLRANPQLVSLRNGLGETVLHYLAVENHSEGVAWLHARGFDIDSQNEFGTPVVFEVAQLGYKDLLLWFKEAGAIFEQLTARETRSSLICASSIPRKQTT
jgi:ankyrin repeat protein